MYRLVISISFVVVVLASVVAAGPSVDADEVQTAAQAIARALRFFEDVGWETTGEATAVFGSSSIRPGCWAFASTT